MAERKEDIQLSFCSRDRGFWCCTMAMNKSSLGKCRVSERVSGRMLVALSVCRKCLGVFVVTFIVSSLGGGLSVKSECRE